MASFSGDNDTFRQEYRRIEGAVLIAFKMQRMSKEFFNNTFVENKVLDFTPFVVSYVFNRFWSFMLCRKIDLDWEKSKFFRRKSAKEESHSTGESGIRNWFIAERRLENLQIGRRILWPM